MARPPRIEDASVVGGVSSQRMDANFSAFSARLMQQDHFARLYHGGSPSVPPRSEPAQNFMPKPLNMVDGQHYGTLERDHFLAGSGRQFNNISNGMLASVDKPGGLGDESQRFGNGSSYASNVVNTSPRVLDWVGNEHPQERVGEAEYRVMEDGDGGSSGGSQSDGSGEDEDDDGDDDGDGDCEIPESHQGRTRLLDHSLPSQRSHELVSSMQSEGMEASRQELAAGPQSSEGLQKDGDLSSHPSTSSRPSVGVFLSPSSTVPFLSSFSSSPVGPIMGSNHDDSDRPSAPNGTLVGASGIGTSHGYYRDGMAIMKDAHMKESQNFSSDQDPNGPHSHSSPPILEAVPIGSATAQCYNSLVQATTTVSSQEHQGTQIVAYSHRKGHESLQMPLRAALTDPLTGALMDDATILLCGHSFGNESLQRVLENNACISCGAAARREDMAPNHALRLVVQAYKREERRCKENAARAARRRRERLEQERHNAGELVPYDLSRHKGVQFPYKVNDRVLIKGNKRTPERFVGRNAVITTQCLNGWYVVRTLDNGESVKLQYRSLKKMDDQQPSKELETNTTATPNWL